VQGRFVHILYLSILTGAVPLCTNFLLSQSKYDTIKPTEPKHFFNTVIFFDGYTKPKQTLNDTSDYWSQRLKTYAVKQRVLGFCTPIRTSKEFNKDSTVYSNTHYLLSGQAMILQPRFDGLKNHRLLKAGIGLRIIHNTGKKGLWFFEISPFITTDLTYGDRNGYLRMANSVIYSHNFSDKFNLRAGFTKSFLWGNRNYLPYLGFRIGRLEKVHFSLQIPKNMSLNIPLSKRFRMSIYTKPQGGMFTFSNRDSLYYFNPESDFFNFTRYEILSGLRFDAVFNNVSCYLAFGSSSRNNITFYSEGANLDRNKPYRTYFYERNLKATGFLNLGMVVWLGKTKNLYGNRNLYDAIDLNNTIGIGDNNINPGNNQIPVKESIKRSKLNLADIQDLIDANDF